MKGPGILLAALFALGYPFIVYFGISSLGPRILAVVLMGFTLVRYFGNPVKTTLNRLVCLLVIGLCILIMLLDSEPLLRAYPVLFSLGMAAAFYFSLDDEYTLIERLALRFGSDLHPTARRYIRRLTMWWTALLLVNAMISAYTAVFGSLYQWTLYNGLISYLVMATFMFCEWCFRLYYKKSRGIVS